MSGPLDILVVDDNALDRELVRRLLPPEHSVREAATAGEARAELGRAVPDLVLLDNRLPDADGIDVLPLLAELHLPVVMLTEVEAPEVIVVAMQRGAEDYLVKGALTRDGLSRAIVGAVEKSALRKRLHQQQEALAELAGTLEVRNGEIRGLATALTLAEQAERHRISEVLHDDVQQLLVGAQIHLSVLQSAEPSRHMEIARTASGILHQATLRMRDLVAELNPPVLENDLESALEWLADHMSRLHHVTVDVVTSQSHGRLPPRDVRVLVVQMVRELVFNAVKHAGTDRICVRLTNGAAMLVVAVEDEGGGFDPAEVQMRPVHGCGLRSVRERLRLIGGGLEITSGIGEGTRATITVPT